MKQKDISCPVGVSFRTKGEALGAGDEAQQCHRGRHWHAKIKGKPVQRAKKGDATPGTHDWQEESTGRWRCEVCGKKRKSSTEPRPGVCQMA